MNGYFEENEFINLKKSKYNIQEQRVSQRSSVRSYNASANTRADSYNYNHSAAELVGDALTQLKKNKARQDAMRPLYNRKRVKSSKPFPFGFLLSTVIISATFMFITYNYSIINEISYNCAALEDEIEFYTQENQRLSVELEQKNDLALIEEIATTKLGMVKNTDVYKQYVSLSGSDKTVVSENAADEFGLGTTLNSLKRSVGKIFE